MSRFRFWLLKAVFGKDENIMVVIYVALITRGMKTIDEVPVKIRDQVKQMLIDLECPDMAESED